MCYKVRFVTKSVKCMVTMRWVMSWLGNGFGCSMKDDRTCTMRREVGVHLWWMMIWCVRSTKECVTTEFHNFWSVPALSSDFKDSMTLSVVANIAGGRILWGGYTKTLCPAKISASIMAANMWKNSLKNVESDNNKILYETLLDFFYSETVLTFWISLVVLSSTRYQPFHASGCYPIVCPTEPQICSQAVHVRVMVKKMALG